MATGNLCEVCPPRVASISVAQWLTVMRIPATCVIDEVTRNEIERAVLRADEEIANYAGWWPGVTAICEEHEIGMWKGRCRFAQAGSRGWITLRYGKVRSIDQVEFLRAQGSPASTSSACGGSDECYTVEPGAVCLIDSDYGSVEIKPSASSMRSGPQDISNASISRIRIRYTAGECGQLGAFPYLIARLAATYLCSPFLCGIDLRCDRWDFYDLNSNEAEHTGQETVNFEGELDGSVKSSSRVSTERTLAKTQQAHFPFPANLYECPFGPTRSGWEMWQYLRSRRRLRIWRM